MSDRVVVLRALGLGDLLTAVPALRGVRRAHPAARLVVATSAGLAPLLDLVGGVDAVTAVGPWIGRPPSGRPPAALRGAALAVNLHGHGPQSTALLRAARPDRLVTYPDTAAWRDDEHEVDRWCRLVGAAGMPADPVDLGLTAPAVPSPAPGAVVVHPGAAYGAKRWPADRWASAARQLRRAGFDVVVTGTAAERPLARQVAAAAGLPRAAVLAGCTDLPVLAALVAGAALVLCGDTGVAHLASAYRTRSVVVFGPTAPAQWGPPDRPEHRALWAGRLDDPFGAVPSAGLLAIGVDDVLAAADAVLAPAPTVRV